MPDLIVHFKKPRGWQNTINIYYWNTTPLSSSITWPGLPMTAEDDDWFVYRLEGIATANIIFNDGAGRQTANLRRDKSGWFFLDNRWYDQKPSDPNPDLEPPTITDGSDFREETIYFLITTRFYDGDPSNNFFCRDRIKFNPTTGEAEDPHWRGDFKGLIQQLDYIKELGFSAIWITPPIENRSGLDYHGYHGYDWTRIDPRLESPDATYQDLINEAHARGLKIIQDVVVNHSSQYGIRGKVWIDHLPIKYYVPAGSEQGQMDNGPYQGNLGNYQSPFREDNDNPVAPEWFRKRQNSDPEGIVPLIDPLTGITIPSPGYNPNRFFGIDANNLDPEWYHQDGFMAGGDWESTAIHTKHLAGDTIDLATRRSNVKEYLINAVSKYLDMGVDALRIDTVKHVERNNLLEYINAWKESPLPL